MSNLTDLVPPLELCKLIPAGEFEDSAFVWALRKAELPYIGRAIGVNMGSVIDGDYCLCTREYAEKVRWVHGKDNIPCPTVPAPTLQEIMADMQYCRVYKKTTNFYVAVKEKDRVVSFNDATAALKLWLKLKGIEA